jgi:hypothetical protein
MLLEFTKMHGLGNDFIVVEDLGETLDLAPEAVAWFCHRNFGIGSDGLILVRPSSLPDADFFMLYYNADGTTAEMCGNGVRCFAKYLVDRVLIDEQSDSSAFRPLAGSNPSPSPATRMDSWPPRRSTWASRFSNLHAIPVHLPGERVIGERSARRQGSSPSPPCRWATLTRSSGSTTSTRPR